jgi:hypothetical protein
MFTRIYPYANTNGIKPQFLHQSRTLTLLTFGIIEVVAFGFVFGDPPYVSTFGKFHLCSSIVTVGIDLRRRNCFVITATRYYSKSNTQKERQKFHVFHGKYSYQ